MNARVILIGALVLVLLHGSGDVSAQCTGTLSSTGTPPLCDLGPAEYAPGHVGGLYPGGLSTRPAAHELAGLDIATTLVVPRDATGAPDPEGGLIGMISVGMSNTTQEFSRFVARAAADAARDPRLVIVDGAQGGQAAEDWAGSQRPWDVLAARVAAAGLEPAQVQVVWIKQANRGPGSIGDFPVHAAKLQADLAAILRRLSGEFPELRLAYLSSRTRAWTDARAGLNPEPFAYESGFSVRWLIEDQLAGVAGMRHESGEVPWLSWGPYLWADGESPRSDGFVWLAADLNNDCTHPSTSGREKVADQLEAFFRADATAAPWFLRQPVAGRAPAVEVTPADASGPVPLAVRFSVEAAAAPGAAIAGHAWSFDDGTTSLSADPLKTFLVPGTYVVRLTVSDDEGNTTRVAVPVTAGPGDPTRPVIVAPASPLPPGTVGAPYSASFAATGSAPIAWRVVAGALPPGIELDAAGRYAGTPSERGAYSFTVEASNPAGVDTAVFEHEIAPPEAVLRLAPVADAYVRDGASAGTNFGSADRVAVRASATVGQNARAYLRFDLGGIEGPIERATLRIFASGLNGGALSATALAVEDDSWSEAGITWNTAPPGGAVIAATVVDRAQATYDLDLTEFARDELADGLASICLVDPGDAGPLAFFDSREGGTPPLLELALEAAGEADFLRADCNADGAFDISDPVRLLLALFVVPGTLPCEDACDTGDDGGLEISDAIASLDALFLAGPRPAPPFPACGPDAGDDPLGCAEHPGCR